MPKLIVQHQGQESTVELKQGSNVVGRQSTCDVPIKESQLSRQHCDIVLAGSTCIVVDKGSMNGTLVNGKRISGEQLVKAGDKIVVGPVVLWYDHKNVAAEAPAAAPPTSHVATAAPTRRALSAEAPPPPIGPGAAAARERAAELLRDYAVRARPGGYAGKIVGALALVAALAVLAVLARNFLNRPSGTREDLGGLVKDGDFESTPEGRPSAWVLPEKPASTMVVDARQGRGGGACLAVDKATTPADRLLVCAYGQEFPLSSTSVVEAAAQVRYEAFSGWTALKVDWLKEPRGALLSEEIGDAVTGAAGWTGLSARFSPPAGAGGFRLGLAFLGRGGRILIDDVSLRTAPGGGPGREHKFGTHLVRPTGQGVLQVLLPRHPFLDLQVQLESDKDGSLRQSTASQVSLSPQENLIDVKGKLLSPVDFREIEFEQRVAMNGGGTTLEYGFKGESLRQIDRVSIVMTLPRGTGAPDPELATQPRSRVSFRTADGAFVLDYTEPVKVTGRALGDGRWRIVQTFPVDSQQEELIFGVRLREEGAGVEADPQKAADAAEKGRRYGESLALLRGFVSGVKEQGLRERIEKRIRGLEEAEFREWAETQGAVFRAGLLRRPAVLTKAREQLDTYAREWSGVSAYEVKLAEKRGELAKTPVGSDADALKAASLLEQAKSCVQSGRKAIARALLETLLQRFPESDAAAPAREQLKTLEP